MFDVDVAVIIVNMCLLLLLVFVVVLMSLILLICIVFLLGLVVLFWIVFLFELLVFFYLWLRGQCESEERGWLHVAKATRESNKEARHGFHSQ